MERSLCGASAVGISYARRIAVYGSSRGVAARTSGSATPRRSCLVFVAIRRQLAHPKSSGNRSDAIDQPEADSVLAVPDCPRPARAQFEEVRSIIVAGHVGRRELFDLELAASMVAEEVVRVAAQAHEAGRTPGTGGVTAPRAVNALRDEHLRSWAWAVSAMAGTEGFR